MSISFGGDGYKGAYCKIWTIEDKGKYIKANGSTSRKVNDVYENSPWNLTFLGSCVEKARKISKDDKIILKAGSFSNTKSKSDGKYYVNVAIFAFDFPEYEDKPAKKAEPVPEKTDDGFYTLNEDDADLPF